MAEWKTVEQRRKELIRWQAGGLWFAGSVGAGGFIALIVGIQNSTLAWGDLSFGERVGIPLYVVATLAGLVVWGWARRSLSRLESQIAEGAFQAKP